MRIATVALAIMTVFVQQTNAFTPIQSRSFLLMKQSLPIASNNITPTSIEATLQNDDIQKEEPSSTKDMKKILFNKNDDTSTKIENVRNSLGFRNDGKYWFMKTLMEIYKEGTQIVNGIPMEKKDTHSSSSSPTNLSEEDAQIRRATAAQEGVNIDDIERQRRFDSGTTFLIAAALYSIYLVYVVDQGDTFGHLVRFSVYPLFATGYGLRESGKAGL